VNREKMEILLAVLLDVPAERFDMGYWCGTACCAAGHYMEKQGNECALKIAPQYGYPRVPVPEHKENGKQCYSALACEFGLSREQAKELFDPGEYSAFPDVPKADVIHRIKRLLRDSW